MMLHSDDKNINELQELPPTEIILKLFLEFEECSEEDQRQKIIEMNGLIKEMNGEEFDSIFSSKLFDKILKMIEEEKLSMGNACLLLKRVGYFKGLKGGWIYGFEHSLLIGRFEKMMIDENEKKKEEKNEKFLIDLCECFALLNSEIIPDELLSIIVPLLLKVALKKEENEKMQKEEEIALLALSCIDILNELDKEQYFNEIIKIIKYHQEHRNLTRLAYHSAWKFLICRIYKDNSLEDVIVNELHFTREAIRELEELAKWVDGKREKEEERRGKEVKEEFLVVRWIISLNVYLFSCKLWNEELVGILNSIVQIFKEAKDNHREISRIYLCFMSLSAGNKTVQIDDMLKSGAIDFILEEIHGSAMDDYIVCEYLHFSKDISLRLKEKTDNKMEEVKRKIEKRKVFDKMEEEGYSDTVTSFKEIFEFLNKKYYGDLSLNISDYFWSV